MTELNPKQVFQDAARWTTRHAKNAIVGLGIGLGLVGGAFAVQTTHQELRLNKAMQFVTAPATTTAISARNLSFGPFAEATDLQRTVGLALKPAPNNQTSAYAALSAMGSSHYAIVRNAAVLDGAMIDCRVALANCSPALDQFRQLIDTARTIADPVTKAQIVNAWVNTAIAYDDAFVLAQKASPKQLIQAPNLVETLESGKGICDQQAQLKLYALSRAGMLQKDLRYVALMVVKDGKWTESHAVVLARLNGRSFVLNGQQFDRDFPGQGAESDNRRLTYNSALQMPRSMLNLDYDAPFRQGGASFLPLYSANYITAQPYQGMRDDEKPPYYRGAPFARHVIQQREAPVTNGQTTLAQQIAISAVLTQALQFQDTRPQTLTLPAMTINAGAMRAAEARRPNNGTEAKGATPEL